MGKRKQVKEQQQPHTRDIEFSILHTTLTSLHVKVGGMKRIFRSCRGQFAELIVDSMLNYMLVDPFL